MTTSTEQDLLNGAEAVVGHLMDGGSLKTLVGLGDKELASIYAVAHVHFTAGKYDKAMDLFKFLCLCDHTEPKWFYSLGVTAQRKGDYAAALEAFGVAVLLDVDDPRPQAQAGYCLMAQGRWPEAESALEGAILSCEDDPAHAETQRQAEAMLETVKSKLAGKKAT